MRLCVINSVALSGQMTIESCHTSSMASEEGAGAPPDYLPIWLGEGGPPAYRDGWLPASCSLSE